MFYMRDHIDLVYILQNRVEKSIVYFLWQIIFRAILVLTLECLDNIKLFLDSCKFRISVFYMREHIELVYIFQNRVEKIIVYFFWQSNFAFNIGVPRQYLDFFDSGKIRISVFYMRQHIELVYILQNGVEKVIEYFFWQIIFRAILLIILWCLYNI